MQKRAVVLEPEERKAVALLQQIQALRKDKVAKRVAKKDEGREKYLKKQEKVDERKGDKQKEERRELLKKRGREEKRAGESEGGRGRKRQKK